MTYLLEALNVLGTRGFSSATGSFVSSAHRPKAADTSGEAFRAGRSLFRTLSKPETAHEKPLAPRQGSHCSMQQEKLSPGVSKCNHPRCLTSPFLKHGQANFTFTSTKEKRRIHDPLNCKSKNLIYLTECKKCGKQYIGETKHHLHERFGEYRRFILNYGHFPNPTPVFEHFN